MDNFNIRINSSGKTSFIYSDELVDLLSEGQVTIRRASHVEPHPDGGWIADMGPSNGPVLGPYPLRSIALEKEIEWLNNHLFGGDHGTTG